MSGISRIKNPINEALGLNEWGEREAIPNDFNSEIVETNQEFNVAGIDASRIKNLYVDSITIPKIGTPLFTVDMEGNVVANSLKRNDFHWFTTFESLDGYGNIGGTLSGDDLAVSTTNVINNVALIQKRIAGTVDTWDKKRSCKFYLNNDGITGISNVVATIGFGSTSGTLTLRRIQLLIDSNGYQAMCANGTTTTKTMISGGGSVGTWEIVFNPGVDAKFYGDGVLKATLTTNLPTGTASSYMVLGIYLKTLTAEVQTLKFVYYDFWQEN